MSYNEHQVFIDAENILQNYKRSLREGFLFGTTDVRVLIETLEMVLDKYAELASAVEPDEPEDFEPFLDPDFVDEDDPSDYDPFEDEGDFPFHGDGDHSDERGNG